MANWNEWNRAVIEEFRENGGKVGGDFDRCTPVTSLHNGSQDRAAAYLSADVSARQRQTCRVRIQSRSPTNPPWFNNLVADSNVTLEVCAELFNADAAVLTGEEQDGLYARQAELYPQFAEYQQNTTRQIPVVALKRKEVERHSDQSERLSFIFLSPWPALSPVLGPDGRVHYLGRSGYCFSLTGLSALVGPRD